MGSPPADTTSARCPVCNGERSRPIWQLGDRLFGTTDRLFWLRRCSDCATDYLDPMPEAHELAGYYPEGYWVGPAEAGRAGMLDRATALYRRLVLKDHVTFVRRVIEEQQDRGLTPRVVDVGCGDGSYLAALRASGSAGMDVSMPALRASLSRGLTVVRGSVCRGERSTAPFADGSFSLVVSFHFLEHVPDPRPVIAELLRLLQPGGDLVIQVPNKGCWQARLFGRRWSGLDVPRHLVNYSTRTLCDVLRECGLTVVRQSHYSLRDNPTILVNSLVPGLYPLARQARRLPRTGPAAWIASVAYLALTLVALPLTLVESCFGRGAAVTVQARKDPV
jgi:SAM-dependent methyltransferase